MGRKLFDNKRTMAYYEEQDRDPLVELILTFFFGELGVHKFYMGQIGYGVLYLLTVGLFGIGAIIDFIQLLINYLDISRHNNISHREKSTITSFTVADELKKYKELLDNGVITDDEFEQRKKLLMEML